MQEYEERLIYFNNFFVKIFDALTETLEKVREKNRRVLGLYHQEVETNGTEAALNNAEIMRQLRDSSVKWRQRCYN